MIEVRSKTYRELRTEHSDASTGEKSVPVLFHTYTENIGEHFGDVER